MKTKGIISILSALAVFCAAHTRAADFDVASPDGRLRVVVKTDGELAFSIFSDGTQLVEDCRIALKTDKGAFGENSKAKGCLSRNVDKTLNTVWGTHSKIRDNFNEITVEFDNFALIFRAYDDAVAYRFSPRTQGEIKIFDELLTLPFDDSAMAVMHPIKGFNSSFEATYKKEALSKMPAHKMVSLPIVIQAAGAKIAITDADVYNYPQMLLHYPKDAKSPRAIFAPYPKELYEKDIFLLVKEPADFIAVRDSAEPTPWRAFIVAREDRLLTDSTIVYRLSRESKIKDPSWIKPGNCVWEWWNNWNLEGVDFVSGVNVETYKYYIDFAAKFKIPYLLFDAGWLEKYDEVDSGTPVLDVERIIKYASSKGVKCLMWSTARPLNDKAKARAAFERFSKWGVVGLKIDFTDRDDQMAIDFFESTAELAAEFKLMVDYHGCPKPAGLYRTWPNVVNFEGVRGNEFNKFEKDMTPNHDLDLLFTRLIAGPMDYTPGAMRNVLYSKWDGDEFAKSSTMTMTRGTRAHQGAMYVLFFAPLQMLCDSPTLYEKSPDFTKFIADCPTVWDDTIPLAAELGKYAVLAKRSGDVWYVGAMAGNEGREVEIKLDFLPAGESFNATILRDTQNSNRLATDYKIETVTVKKGDAMKIKMANGGGFAARFEKK